MGKFSFQQLMVHELKEHDDDNLVLHYDDNVKVRIKVHMVLIIPNMVITMYLIRHKHHIYNLHIHHMHHKLHKDIYEYV